MLRLHQMVNTASHNRITHQINGSAWHTLSNMISIIQFRFTCSPTRCHTKRQAWQSAHWVQFLPWHQICLTCRQHQMNRTENLWECKWNTLNANTWTHEDSRLSLTMGRFYRTLHARGFHGICFRIPLATKGKKYIGMVMPMHESMRVPDLL